MGKRRGDEFEDSDEFKDIQISLGQNIRKIRHARGLTQRQLADLAEISAANYGLVEAGVGNASLLILARIARALAVPVTGLFEGTVGATTSGVEGVFIRILSELDRVRHHMDVRRDELGKLSSEIQGYVELNREAVKAMADEGKATAVPRRSRTKATTSSS
jgi:transcriptional regulator with XRE-family HTH domain